MDDDDDDDGDDANSFFSSYVTKLAEFENSSYSILNEAKQTLHKQPHTAIEHNKTDTAANRDKNPDVHNWRGSYKYQNEGTEGGHCLNRTERSPGRRGLIQYQSINEMASKMSDTGSLNGTQVESTNSLPPQSPVCASATGKTFLKHGRDARRSSVPSGCESTSVESRYLHRHSHDASMGGRRSARLRYDHQEQLFMKNSDTEDLTSRESSSSGEDDQNSNETDELMKELQCRQVRDIT